MGLVITIQEIGAKTNIGPTGTLFIQVAIGLKSSVKVQRLRNKF